MRSVAALLLALITVPCLASGPLRPEIALGAPPLEAAHAWAVSAASMGATAFAVWNSDDGVAGTALDADGTVRSPQGVHLSSALLARGHAIAAADRSYVVSLASYQANGTCCIGSTIAIDGDGSIVRENVVYGSTSLVSSAELYGNSSRILLVNGNDLAFVEPDGRTTAVGHFPASVRAHAVVAVSDGFNVYALDSAEGSPAVLHRLHVDNSGTITDKVLPGEWQASRKLSAATDGRNDLLAWTNVQTISSIDWSGQQDVRITTAAAIYDRDGLRVGQPATLDDRRTNIPEYIARSYPAPSIVWTGSQCIVTYYGYDTNQARFYIAPVSAGSGPGATPVTLGAYLQTPVFTSTGAHQLMLTEQAWLPNDSDDWSTAVVLKRAFESFDDLFSAADDPLVRAPSEQLLPTVSSDGTVTVAAWLESRFQAAVSAQIVSATGECSRPLILSDSSLERWQPVVASGRGVHLVAWRELRYDPQSPVGRGYRILARRVRNDGTTPDPVPLVLENGKYRKFESAKTVFAVSAVWDGSQFVVGWIGAGGDANIIHVPADGLPNELPMLLSGSPPERFDIHLVTVGSDTIALYFVHPLKNVAAIEGIRIDKNGGMGAPVSYAPPDGSVYELIPFAASSNGTEVVLAWQQTPVGLTPARVVARRFSPAGVPIGPEKEIARISTSETAPIGQLIAEGGGWWFVTRRGYQTVMVRRLDRNLDLADQAIEMCPWGAGPSDAAGLIFEGKLLLAYSRISDPALRRIRRRAFMQWLFLNPRERAVRR